MDLETYKTLHWELQGEYLVLENQTVISKDEASPWQMLRAAFKETQNAWKPAVEGQDLTGTWVLEYLTGTWVLEYSERLRRLQYEALSHALWAIERLTGPVTDAAQLTYGRFGVDEDDGWVPREPSVNPNEYG